MTNWADKQKKEPEPEPPFRITPRDSNDPSYTNLTLPYRVICRQRYRRAGKLQRAQFINEIKEHELLQARALGGVRIHREFCNAILSMPNLNDLIKLSINENMRLEEILNTKY
ncbi:unnamed protein product [Acanthoscelides obtectus]|uniref:Uncharacterized protein n=1 Tax=Acanthoscelides obtectus TaxID=200917 RepID=A0A9P0JY00_ACAOB|nr:unnamed protein product [Acanthoscelides obtectus]CAK1642209.1 hypothetical protein AOBTE_LOCUS12887 [Acanthoscelides obtectus]